MAALDDLVAALRAALASVRVAQQRGMQVAAVVDGTEQAAISWGNERHVAELGTMRAGVDNVAATVDSVEANVAELLQRAVAIAGGSTPAVAAATTTGGSGGSAAASAPESSRLVNADRARVDDRKFTAYSMAPENPNNEGKWQAWRQLGYDLANRRQHAADDVMRQLRAQLPHAPISGRIETKYGPRHSVRTTVTGPNGRAGTLVSVWQYDDGHDEPRMITHWLEVHTGKGER